MRKRDYKKVAKLIKDAKDLMNNKGEHWIKGSMRHNHSFCSVGGLRYAATKRVTRSKDPILMEAHIVLAETITGKKRPKELPPAPKQYKSPYSYLNHDPHKQYRKKKNGLLEYQFDWAESKIIGFNDLHTTTWTKVARKFQTAARRAEKMAS